MGYSGILFKNNETVVITGGAGFIGSNLCEAFLKQGAKVICYDNLSTGFKKNIAHLLANNNFKFVKGDICDFKKLLKITKNADYIVHEAAWGSVPRSIKMPVFYEHNNIRGTLNVFEVARQNGIKKVVYASSSSVYGDSAILPKSEGKEGTVLSPYALTKKVDEEYGSLYWRLYKLPTIGLRYFNVFGRRQNPNGEYAAVIPLFFKSCINNGDVFINGDGSYSRDFTYIENVIEANIKACLCSNDISYGKAFNIAYGGRVTINNLFLKIAELTGYNKKPIYREVRNGDIAHSNADISLAKKLLKYDPDYDFNSGIVLASKWYETLFKKID